jgi:hypothetical protein
MSTPVDRLSLWGVIGQHAVQGEVHDPYADRPWQNPNEGFAVSSAGRLAQMPAEEVQAIRPAVPQQLFPEEYGYDQTPVTIEQVLDINRWTPSIRSWTSPWMRSTERAESDAQIQSGPTPAMSVSPFG